MQPVFHSGGGDAQIGVKMIYFFLIPLRIRHRKKIRPQGHLDKLISEGPLQSDLVISSRCKWH